MTSKDLFVECEMVGLDEDGIWIPFSEIPKIEARIKLWRKKHPEAVAT